MVGLTVIPRRTPIFSHGFTIVLHFPPFARQYRPLIWRNTHPYVVIDRHEDVTNPNDVEKDSECDRSVIFYGYVRART